MGTTRGAGIVQGQLRHDLDIELVVDLLISPIFSRRVMSGGSLPDQLPDQLIATVWKAFVNLLNPQKIYKHHREEIGPRKKNVEKKRMKHR